MEITSRFNFVEGSFDTLTDTMLCLASDEHGIIELCLKEQDCGWIIPIGQIKLYSGNLYKDFKATYNDAEKLGNEIARRWNECADKQYLAYYRIH